MSPTLTTLENTTTYLYISYTPDHLICLSYLLFCVYCLLSLPSPLEYMLQEGKNLSALLTTSHYVLK